MQHTPSSITGSEYLTPEEVAALVRVHLQSVYRWLREGRIEGLKAGPKWRISPEALQAFLRREIRERR